MTKRNTRLIVDDRFVLALKDAGVDYNSGYGEMFGSLARYASSVCPKDAEKPVQLQLLHAATEQGYHVFYSKYLHDIGHETLTGALDAIGLDHLLKLDMYYYIAKNTVCLVVDAYPAMFKQLPGLGVCEDPLHFHYVNSTVQVH